MTAPHTPPTDKHPAHAGRRRWLAVCLVGFLTLAGAACSDDDSVDTPGDSGAETPSDSAGDIDGASGEGTGLSDGSIMFPDGDVADATSSGADR